jgi:hypothetical protein
VVVYINIFISFYVSKLTDTKAEISMINQIMQTDLFTLGNNYVCQTKMTRPLHIFVMMQSMTVNLHAFRIRNDRCLVSEQPVHDDENTLGFFGWLPLSTSFACFFHVY